MRTKSSKLPSAKPQIALLAMALVIGSGAVYAQGHRGQVGAASPTQALQSSQSSQSTQSAQTSQNIQSVTTATNSSFAQPAQSSKKVFTLSHGSTRPQIAGGAHGDDDGENGDD
jgi:cytoskeletal protein RodZ